MKIYKFRRILAIVLTLVLAQPSISNASENVNIEYRGNENTGVTVITESDTKFNTAYCPAMFMQDFDYVMPNNKNVSESGNLLTCLCMIASYLESEAITPNEFVEMYPQVFDENGNIDIDTFTYLMWIDNEGDDNTYKKEDINLDTMFNYLQTGGIVLVYIPNPSKYGMNSTYMVLTGIDKSRFAVLDPNKNNIALADTSSRYGNYYYEIADVLTAMGENSFMVLFKVTDYE